MHTCKLDEENFIFARFQECGDKKINKQPHC